MPKKSRIPARRVVEKIRIWNAHDHPVGFKFAGKAKIEGEWKHFEFSVIEESRMRRTVMYFWVRTTIRKMVYEKKLPQQCYYHAYDGFMFLHGTDWIDTEDIVYDFKHTAT